MRNFSKVLALVTGSLLIATAMTKPILGAEMEETEQSQPPPTSSQQPISPEELFQGLEERNLGTENTNFRELIADLVTRTRKLFSEGKPLINELSGKLKLELKTIINGGFRILDKIEEII